MDITMDSNGLRGVPFAGVPLGFSMALAMNEKALDGYAKMTEAQKEELINRSRDAKSKAEMERIVNSIVDNETLGTPMDTDSIL